MTKDQLRRRFIVTVHPTIGGIVRRAFDEDDKKGRRFTRSSFSDFFDEAHAYIHICEAWEIYQKYHNELAHYEPEPPQDEPTPSILSKKLGDMLK